MIHRMGNAAAAVATTLREYVDAHGTRYIKLAELLGVSPAQVSRLLDGKRRITERHAERLAEFYGEPREFFLGLRFIGGDE